jgi:hypothetical protein
MVALLHASCDLCMRPRAAVNSYVVCWCVSVLVTLAIATFADATLGAVPTVRSLLLSLVRGALLHDDRLPRSSCATA